MKQEIHDGTETKPRAQFSKVPKRFRAWKAVYNPQTLSLQSCFIYILLIWTKVPFKQEVSSAYIFLFWDTDQLQMA